MHTVSADGTHEHGADCTHHQASVAESIRHRQDPCPNVPLQQMDHSVQVPEQSNIAVVLSYTDQILLDGY